MMRAVKKKHVRQRLKAPMISVVLCTFNRARLLMRAIDSVFEQTCDSWELLIIDDGSTDRTVEVVLPLTEQDPRVTYLRHRNRGLAMSRNVGLQLASGKYVTFLDSDDEYEPTHLKARLSYLEKHPGIDALHGGLKFSGPRSRHYVPDLTAPGKKIHLSKCAVGGTMVAKRAVLRKIQGFRNLAFGEDYELIHRLESGYNVKRVRWPTYVYHTDAPDRLCDLYALGGEAKILRTRGRRVRHYVAMNRHATDMLSFC